MNLQMEEKKNKLEKEVKTNFARIPTVINLAIKYKKQPKFSEAYNDSKKRATKS